MTMGITEINPVIGTAKPRDAEPRARVLEDAELAKIWRACKDDDYGRIVRLAVLSGCRRQEIGGMAWAELDRERGIWVIPASRTKNHRSHTLPMPPSAWSIIDSAPQIVGRKHVFGGGGDRGFQRWSAGKRELDERAGVTGWHLHDTRRTFCTRLADLGIAPHVIEAAVNHASGSKAGVAGTYNRATYEREVRAALAIWADHVRALVEGDQRKILPIRS
jgi:integrase